MGAIPTAKLPTQAKAKAKILTILLLVLLPKPAKTMSEPSINQLRGFPNGLPQYIYQDSKLLKVAFFQKVEFVLQIPNLQKNIPKNYPELEI